MRILSLSIKKELSRISCSLLRIISPWIKYDAFKYIIDKTKANTVYVISRFDRESLIRRSSDYRVFEYIYSTPNFEIRIDNSIHSKMYIFDDKYIYVGSANLTNAGFGLNTEINKEIGFFTDNQDLIQQGISYFENIWNSGELLDEKRLNFGRYISNLKPSEISQYYSEFALFSSLISSDLRWYEIIAIVLYLIGDPLKNYCTHLSEIYRNQLILTYLKYKNNRTYTDTIRRTLQEHNESEILQTEKRRPYYFIYCDRGYFGLSSEGLKYVKGLLQNNI